MDVTDHPNSINPLMIKLQQPFDRLFMNSINPDYINSSSVFECSPDIDHHQFCIDDRTISPDSSVPKYLPDRTIARLLRNHGTLLSPVRLDAHDHSSIMQGLMVNQGGIEDKIKSELRDKESKTTSNDCMDVKVRSADGSSTCTETTLATGELSTDVTNNHKNADQGSGINPCRRKTKKRSRSEIEKRVVYVPATLPGDGANASSGVASDTYAWRKYGQKPIKGSPYPRGYYRCSTVKGCPAKKQVEKNPSNPAQTIITYTFEHNHDQSVKETSRSKLHCSSRDVKPYEDHCDDLRSMNMDKSHDDRDLASEESCGPNSSLDNYTNSDEINNDTSRDDEFKAYINHHDENDANGSTFTASLDPGTSVMKADDEFFRDLAWILGENTLDDTNLADPYPFTI